MDNREADRILELLRCFFPRARELQDENVRFAWKIVLQKFRYDDVKNSVIAYATKKRFFPSVADITASLCMERTEKRLGNAEIEAIKQVLEDKE